MLHPLLSTPFSKEGTVSSTLILFITLSRSMLHLLYLTCIPALPFPRHPWPPSLWISIQKSFLCLFCISPSVLSIALPSPVPHFWTIVVSLAPCSTSHRGRETGNLSSPFCYCYFKGLEQGSFPQQSKLGWHGLTVQVLSQTRCSILSGTVVSKIRGTLLSSLLQKG